MKLSKLNIFFLGFLCLLITRSHAQNFNLYAEPDQVNEMETFDNIEKVLGSNDKYFFVFITNHHKATYNDRVIAYDKVTLKQAWMYESHEKTGVKRQLLDGPFAEYTKDGILLFTFDPYVNEEGLSMPTTLINLNTGAGKTVENKFLIKKASAKLLQTPTMKLRLFSQDSSKMYVFTSNNVFGEIGALTVTCIQLSGVKVLWSKPMEMGGMLSNMKFDNDDNLFFLAAEEKDKRFDTYLCKYDFTAGKASGTVIRPDGNRKVNPDLYDVNKHSGSSPVNVTSKQNAVKMELTDKGEPVVAGFFEEGNGKPGYLFQFYSKDLKKQSEKADYFPTKVNDILSKEEYTKTDFYTQELVRIGNVLYIVGQQYTASGAKTKLHDYVFVSLDMSQKVNVTLLPPQDEEAFSSDLYPLNCFKHGDKLWVSYIKKAKDIKGFEGLEVFEQFKPAITSTDKQKSKDLFIKVGTNGVEDVKVLGIALNTGKDLAFSDRLGNSKIYNFEWPLPVLSDGNKAILCITNIVWPNGRATKYCFARLDLK